MTDIPDEIMAKAIKRLQNQLKDFDAEATWELANGGERADLWTEIDVSVDDVRFVIDDYTNLIRQNAELRAEIAALLSERTASEAALKEARAKLFPYADATEISGMSWNGFYLIGDEKSINELRRLENRSSQIEIFKAAFDEKVATLEAENARLRAEAERLDRFLSLSDARSDENLTVAVTNAFQLAQSKARVAVLENALEPFAKVAEHDIGDSEDDDDQFRPVGGGHNAAPLITVGDVRAAVAALTPTKENDNAE